MKKKVTQFISTSVILPAVDETDSLVATVETIRKTSRQDVIHFIFTLSRRASPRTIEICEEYAKNFPGEFTVHIQTLPRQGGALREAFKLVKTSHVIVMNSDLETDPATVPKLVMAARAHPESIVTASRWLHGGGFVGYGPLKLILNYLFQKWIAFLYGEHLTDSTFLFRIFPTHILQSIRWEELGHSLALETLIKPLRLGTPIIEIPSAWCARREGRSHNSILGTLRYPWIGIRLRYSSLATFQIGVNS